MLDIPDWDKVRSKINGSHDKESRLAWIRERLQKTPIKNKKTLPQGSSDLGKICNTRDKREHDLEHQEHEKISKATLDFSKKRNTIPQQNRSIDGKRKQN